MGAGQSSPKSRPWCLVSAFMVFTMATLHSGWVARTRKLALSSRPTCLSIEILCDTSERSAADYPPRSACFTWHRSLISGRTSRSTTITHASLVRPVRFNWGEKKKKIQFFLCRVAKLIECLGMLEVSCLTAAPPLLPVLF